MDSGAIELGMQRSRAKKSIPERLAHGRICDVPLKVETRIGPLEIVCPLSAGC
jgi:hypothetical protein